MKSTLSCLLLLTAFLGASSAQAQNEMIALQARGVLKTHCFRCHHGPGSDSGEFDVLKVETLTTGKDGEAPVVVVSKPADSYLFQRLAIRKGGAGDMPPKEIKERPSEADKLVIKAWIEAGAPAFPAAAGRGTVGTVDVLTAVLDDLRKIDKEDVRYIRYFTLNHLHNNPIVPDSDMRVLRAALSKAVNSLSWKPNIVLPRAVDKAGTVFAIDIRKLDWDRNDLWRSIMRKYPYGLRYDVQRRQELRKLDDDITQITGCEIPVIRADWFVATATRPPLYHDLVQIPTHAGDLEKRLGVDVVSNFKREELARGGFAKSGISGQNRLVERHDATTGAYWKSYDFKAENDRENLSRFPLGPVFTDNPFDNQAFKHDGGEIVFNLPNGLQGYMLVDGKDNRINEGPITVVGDVLKTSGTTEIVNGLSCMVCHFKGMKEFTDQIRTGSGVQGEARRKVLRLYPEPAAMKVKLDEDTRRFMQAAEKATAPFLKVEEDKDKDILAFAEPVGQINNLYRLQDLDLAMTAFELDYPKPDELKTLVAGNKRLRELGLGSLANKDGAIKRHDWEKIGATSLYQRVARELEIGSPYIVTK